MDFYDLSPVGGGSISDCNYAYSNFLYVGPKFNKLYLTDMEAITHNTKLFILKTPQGTFLRVPAGQYVKIRALIEGRVRYMILLMINHNMAGLNTYMCLMFN